jgi:hypothetical protein
MRRWSRFCGIAIAGDIWRTSFRICPTKKHLEGTGTNLSAHPIDRTTYAFEIETSPEQDQALIRKFNSLPNRSHFHILTRNCADFIEDVINVYQPVALRRSYGNGG